MKTRILLCLLSLFAITKTIAQQYIYYFDANMSIVKKKNAVLLGKGTREGNLLKVEVYGMQSNNLVVEARFTDTTLATMQGFFRNYHPNGKIESEGYYQNNKEEGSWLEWDDKGFLRDSTTYINGNRMTWASYDYYEEKLRMYEITDSLKDTYDYNLYDENGNKTYMAKFKGTTGITTKYKDGNITIDTVYTRYCSEANVEGGEVVWRNYLARNLNPNVPVDNGARAGTYHVIVEFMVNTDGSLSDVVAKTKHGYGMEEEVIRLIKAGPKWQPAIRFGHKIRAYRTQPVTFQVNVK